MASKVQSLAKKNVISPPKFLPDNIQYETMMGSIAYGVAEDNSDIDIYGFCIPPKDMIFPHLRGEIMGFGSQCKRFEQYQLHHNIDDSAKNGRGQEVDISIYSIVKYFQLCMENNPNMIDSLFTPAHCILHITEVGNMVRENRKLFLHKGCWPKFKGYAYSQLNKIDRSGATGKRAQSIEDHGYDVKAAYHCVRLLSEVELILKIGDLDLTLNKEQLKSIRRGEWTKEDIQKWFSSKEAILERMYIESTLRKSPDEKSIKRLLLECLEHHYGNLEKCIVIPDKADLCVREIKDVIDRYYSN